MEPESSEDDEKFALRSVLSEMLSSEGWEYFRILLLSQRKTDVDQMVGILPKYENIPQYAAARARIQFIDRILGYSASDILEIIAENKYE